MEAPLRRILVGSGPKNETIPCCAREEDLPKLPEPLRPYVWQAGEVTPEEFAKGQR